MDLPQGCANCVDGIEGGTSNSSKSELRVFDFSRYPRRRIVLALLYLGWQHDGLVTQRDTDNTIEEVGRVADSVEGPRVCRP
jgi:hypothetical protein